MFSNDSVYVNVKCASWFSHIISILLMNICINECLNICTVIKIDSDAYENLKSHIPIQENGEAQELELWCTSEWRILLSIDLNQVTALLNCYVYVCIPWLMETEGSRLNTTFIRVLHLPLSSRNSIHFISSTDTHSI